MGANKIPHIQVLYNTTEEAYINLICVWYVQVVRLFAFPGLNAGYGKDCLKTVIRLSSSSTGEYLLYNGTMIKSCLPDFQGDKRGWLHSRQSHVPPPQHAAT